MIKKALLSFLLLGALFISTNVSLHASEATTLVVNYFRFDDDYSQFDSVWLWPEAPDSGAGERYFWEEEGELGQRLTVDLSETNLDGATEVGVIVRDDDWNKDVDMDRFIDMTNPDPNGVVEVFLVQNDQNIYYSEEEADISHQILQATFEDTREISFNFTTGVAQEDVTITKDGDPIGIETFNIEGSRGTLTIDEDIDLTKTYRMIVDFGDDEPADSRIGFDGFYSSDAFNEAYAYDGDLGALYSNDETEFKLWAPISEGVTLNLYEYGHTASQEDYDGNAGVDEPFETIEMDSLDKGVWSTTVSGDLHGTYYTFTVDNGEQVHEVVDPYAFTTGVNGQRGMVVDFSRTNPEGWEYGSRPNTMNSYTDAIIYELHVRDLTSHESWEGTEDHRGKFLGLIEEGTTYNGVTTGFDHLKELGITHVHLLPVHDNGIIDETRLKDEDYHGIHDGIFNWGYMTRNFNTLEGSYSTDPYNGEVRINEFKQMVQGFHEEDIRVVLDVVYNHTAFSADSKWHKILPGYYHRMTDEGGFSNGSGTGNETASERAMFRKFMVDSILFWVEEYNVDGFRFDLMELHDVETMVQIREAVHEIDDTIILYGEPWTGGESPLPHEDRATKHNLDQMGRIGVFNDITRDGIKGSVFESSEGGFVQGDNFSNVSVLFGTTGGTNQSGVSAGALPSDAIAQSPEQTVNYVASHDNNTLHDKLVLSTFEDFDVITRMQRQANNIVLTSQGIPFLHAGIEMMRTKPCVMPDSGEVTCDPQELFDHNSYRSPDEVNQIDWNWKVDYNDTYEYHRSLIHLRQSKDVFRLSTSGAITDAMTVMSPETGLIAYALEDPNDEWRTILMIHNAGDQSRDFDLPAGEWNVVATTDEIGERIDGGLDTLFTQSGGETITLSANDSFIMYSTQPLDDDTTPIDDGLGTIPIILISVGTTLVVVAGGLVIYKRFF